MVEAARPLQRAPLRRMFDTRANDGSPGRPPAGARRPLPRRTGAGAGRHGARVPRRGPQAPPPGRHHASPFFAQSYERYLRALLLDEAGRTEGARRWYGSFANTNAFDHAFLAPSHYRRGVIAEREGDAAAARRHYERLLELWVEPEPAFQAVVQDVRRRLRAVGGIGGVAGSGALVRPDARDSPAVPDAAVSPGRRAGAGRR